MVLAAVVEFSPTLFLGGMTGMLTRKEALAAIDANRRPELVRAITIAPTTSIREVQRILIDSPRHTVLLSRSRAGQISGIVTLHDLLRAQVAIGEAIDGSS